MPVPGTQTVARLESALALAERLGYRIRLESLWGESGGGCEIRGQKWLFIDLSLTPREQLEQALQALRHEAAGMAAASQAHRAAEASTGAELTADPKSPAGFLPRWQRWYRMVFSRSSDAAKTARKPGLTARKPGFLEKPGF